MTVCKMRSIETIIKIKIKIVNIAKILLYFDFKRKIRVETNASKFKIFDIINQLIEITDQ